MADPQARPVARARPGRAWRGVTKLLARHVPDGWLFGTRALLETVALGEGDGSWHVPARGLEAGAVCYCIGVGSDATFDLALARRFAADVFSFDPTPASIAHMAALEPTPVTFLPWGVWREDERRTMYRQDPDDDNNLSIIDPGEDRGGVAAEAEFFRLPTIMDRLGHGQVDLLKLDVEGAWAAILEHMLDEGIVPDVLCVEFDSPTSPCKVRRIARRLAAAGLRFVRRDREDCLFVAERLIARSGPR